MKKREKLKSKPINLGSNVPNKTYNIMSPHELTLLAEYANKPACEVRGVYTNGWCCFHSEVWCNDEWQWSTSTTCNQACMGTHVLIGLSLILMDQY